MPPIELTLIVAATARDMGIGASGGLPWTGLRHEMAYFARVTKRGENAVIMGRRTWDSIPPRFRPLPGRLNVVISRSFAPGAAKEPVGGPGSGPVEASSLEAALAYLRECQAASVAATAATTAQPSTVASTPSRVFVIGGAQIYAAALGLPATRRVLLTRVLSDFACDTHFPVVLGSGPEGAGTADAAWRQRSPAEHARWIGEDVPAGVQTEQGTDYVFEMWERVDSMYS